MYLELKKRKMMSAMAFLPGLLLLLLALPAQTAPVWAAKIDKLIAQPVYQKNPIFDPCL